MTAIFLLARKQSVSFTSGLESSHPPGLRPTRPSYRNLIVKNLARLTCRIHRILVVTSGTYHLCDTFHVDFYRRLPGILHQLQSSGNSQNREGTDSQIHHKTCKHKKLIIQRNRKTMAPHSRTELPENNIEIVGNASSSSLTSSERRARFALEMEEKVVLIESHKEYTPEEFSNLYWTVNEQDKMRDEQLNTIARMEKGKKAKKDDYRGLESAEVAKAFQQKRDKCVSAVLKAQAENGKCWVSIGNASKSATEESARKALLLAQRDAEEAENAWVVQENRRKKSLPKRLFAKLLRRN